MVGRAGAVRPCGPLSPACAARAPMELRPVCHSGRMHSPDPLLMTAAGRDDGGTGPGARRRARLAASRLYVCTDLQRFLRPDGTLDTAAFADFCAAAFRGGVDVIQVRDKAVDVAVELAAFATLVPLAREHGALSAANDRADVAALRGRDADAAAPAVAPPAPAADPLRDTKLDHSFKIAQVQVRVVREQLAAGEGMDREMVDRALETIDITASNARDMIKESRAGGAEGPVSGTVIG